MNRDKYNSCMGKYMQNQGDITPEERKIQFCIGAKICSGKITDEKKAREVCMLPKDPSEKPVKRSGKNSCKKEMIAAAVCLAQMGIITLPEKEVAALLIKCHCGGKEVTPKQIGRQDAKQQGIDALAAFGIDLAKIKG